MREKMIKREEERNDGRRSKSGGRRGKATFGRN